MQQLFSTFYLQLNRISIDFKRYLYNEIHWQNRLIAIIGSRGTGKTTMLLQHIKLNFQPYSNEVLYASLDNLWFSTHSLIYLADEFAKQGGKILYLNEVHNYMDLSREIKNIYDSYLEKNWLLFGDKDKKTVGEQTNIGSVSESFFMSQVRVRHVITFSNTVDFKVSNKYNIEIGGKNRTNK